MKNTDETRYVMRDVVAQTTFSLSVVIATFFCIPHSEKTDLATFPSTRDH